MTTQEQTSGTGFAGQNQNQGNASQTATGLQVGQQINGITIDRIDPNGRPFVHPSYFDQFPKNTRGQAILPAQLRPASWVPVTVLEVRKYNRGGQPRVSFNQGAIHVSYNQLKSAGVFNPDSLNGKKILVDFFQRGDVLLNGSITTDSGRIVNRFMVEPNQEVENKLEYELKKDALTSWAGLASSQLGANMRGAGEGMQLNTNNGVTPATQIPQMINPNQSAGITREAAASNVDQRLQSGNTGTPVENDPNAQGSTGNQQGDNTSGAGNQQ